MGIRAEKKLERKEFKMMMMMMRVRKEMLSSLVSNRVHILSRKASLQTYTHK